MINGLSLTVSFVETSVHLIDMAFVFIQRLSIKAVHETNAYCHLNNVQSIHLFYCFFRSATAEKCLKEIADNCVEKSLSRISTVEIFYAVILRKTKRK